MRRGCSSCISQTTLTTVVRRQGCCLVRPIQHFLSPMSRFTCMLSSMKCAQGLPTDVHTRMAAKQCLVCRYVLADATQHSLVLVDELGKGTEVNAGAALAGAMLEALDDVGCKVGHAPANLPSWATPSACVSIVLALVPRVAPSILAIAIEYLFDCATATHG